MWEIYEHRRLVRRLQRIPADILKRYEKWKDIVRISGPAGLRAIRGFHDEPLRGEWKNHRSSRLGIQHRIVYRIEAQEILVLVIDITAHDYRRK
jgi:Txe/YoeB family toxin of Txe-Axe toxin-antitoxin module